MRIRAVFVTILLTTTLLTTILLTLAAPAAGREAVVHTLEVQDHSRRYALYVAPGAQAAPAPLIVLLHGSYSDGPWLLARWKAEADRDGLVLAAPDAYQPSGWSFRYDGPDFLRAVVADVGARTPIDPRRIYLFGHSGGAVHALLTALLESRYFAAAAVYAGAFRTPREMAVIRFAERKIPLAIFIGDHDPYFQMRDVRETEERLKAAGIPIAVRVIDGAPHVPDPVLFDNVARDAWRIFAGVTLDGPPVFSEYRQ